MSGNGDKGVEECTKGIEFDPRDWMAYHLRGNAHYNNGEFDLAEEDWGKAQELGY